MNDTIGRMLSLLLVLYSVAHAVSVPTTASSVGSIDTVVVRVGDNMTLQCSAEPKGGTFLGWTYYQPSFRHFSRGSGDQEFELTDCNTAIIDRICKGRTAVETNETVSVLNITNIQPEDAGRYKCHSNNNNSEEKEIFSKELIVIDDHPRCSYTAHKYFDNKETNGSANQRRNKMELHCEVGFTASANGCILEWRIAGMEDVLNSTCINGDNSVKATLTLDAASHSNITSYVCVVRGENYSCETGQIEAPSPECNENVTKSTKTKINPNIRGIVWKQLSRIRSSVDRMSLLLQWRTLRKVSKLVNIQREMLSVESKRLELENSTTMKSIPIEEHGDAKDK